LGVFRQFLCFEIFSRFSGKVSALAVSLIILEKRTGERSGKQAGAALGPLFMLLTLPARNLFVDLESS
jgi:hypothetical protein